MKKLILLIFQLFISNLIFSQENSGKTSIYFESNSDIIILDTTNKNALDSIKLLYNKFKKPISIQAYTNELGSVKENYELSLKRANAVKLLLKKNKILKFEIIKGNGELKGLNELQKKTNRRVDLFISKETTPSNFRKGKKIVLYDLFGDTTKANLDHFFQYSSNRDFYNVINILKKYPTIEFEIQTYYSSIVNRPEYTEKEKSLNYNQQSKKNDFAEAKGKFLRDFFIKEGISKNRMSIKNCKYKKGNELTYGQHVELLILKN